MTRAEAESIFAKVLLGENDVEYKKLCEAISIAVKDMHMMAEIEEIVK